MEKRVYRFYHEFTSINQLKKWKLQIDIGHYWLPDKNSILQAYQSDDWCIGFSRNDYQYDHIPLPGFGVNCHISRLGIHIKIPIFVMLLPKYQAETLNGFSSINK